MARKISRKIRLLSYAFLVLLLGAITSWLGAPKNSTLEQSIVPKAFADVPGGPFPSGGDGPASPDGGPDPDG